MSANKYNVRWSINWAVVMLSVCCLPWSFDFRANEGESFASIIQSIAVLSTIVIFLCAIFLYPVFEIPRSMGMCLISLLMYLSESSLTGLILGQSITTIAPLAVPTLLFLLGSLLSYAACAKLESGERPLKIVISVAVISAVNHVVVTFFFRNETIQETRFEVLGSGTTFVSAYMISKMMNKLYIFDFLVFFLQVSTVALSVTRTVLVVAAAMLGSLIGLNPLLALRRRFVFRLCSLIALIGVVGLAGVFANNEVAQHWTQRLFQADQFGYDVTELTRIAEINYQVSTYFESNISIFFGHGLAATNHLVGDALTIVQSIIGQYELEDIGFGHNLYTSMLFQSGMIFGVLGVVALAYLGFRSGVYIMKFHTTTSFGQAGLVASLATIGTIVYGFLGSPLGDRGTSLFFGVSVGIMFWVSEQEKNCERGLSK